MLELTFHSAISFIGAVFVCERCLSGCGTYAHVTKITIYITVCVCVSVTFCKSVAVLCGERLLVSIRIVLALGHMDCFSPQKTVMSC